MSEGWTIILKGGFWLPGSTWGGGGGLVWGVGEGGRGW